MSTVCFFCWETVGEDTILNDDPEVQHWGMHVALRSRDTENHRKPCYNCAHSLASMNSYVRGKK